ncbi:site-specific DNA-methyltransferase [Priestia sp. GS2]|uniref:site-specific DNA-methyltransferase n=1 Tax=Priestia sp. GS2 TaxID=3117403 RepID=UPI002EDA2FC1
MLKNKVIDDLRNYEPKLLSALLANEAIKNTYSVDVLESSIFKIDEFVSMLRSRTYWGNSYTKFNTEIGLTTDNRYIKHSTARMYFLIFLIKIVF